LHNENYRMLVAGVFNVGIRGSHADFAIFSSAVHRPHRRPVTPHQEWRKEYRENSTAWEKAPPAQTCRSPAGNLPTACQEPARDLPITCQNLPDTCQKPARRLPFPARRPDWSSWSADRINGNLR
jgi:hypothetical protein